MNDCVEAIGYPAGILHNAAQIASNVLPTDLSKLL